MELKAINSLKSFPYLNIFIVLVWLSCFCNNSFSATNYYVSLTGLDSNPGTLISPKRTLTNVLSTYNGSFVFGDTIFIAAGIYNDNNLSSPPNGVVIKGAGNSLTIFDNSCADCYFMYINDNNTQLIDMKLFDYNNLTAFSGQVLGILSSTTGVTIKNVIVHGSSTSSGLADFPIVVKSGAQVTFIGGGATCNDWDAGGGIYVTGASTNVLIQNYLFVGNYQLWASPSVGGLWVDGGTVNVKNSRFENNEVDGSTFVGSAVYVTGGNVSIVDCVLDGNKSYLTWNSVGGTVYVGGGTFRIARSIISNHSQTNGTFTSYGAGIGITGGIVTIDSCKFLGNSGSATRGKDVYNDGGAVTARYCSFGSTSNQVGSKSGTFTISNSGTPSFSGSYDVGLTFPNNTNTTYIANPNTAMYSGTCASAIIILPIELIDFKGRCEKTHMSLEWATASEHNNDYFTIDRAGSNGVFYELAKVNGKMNTTQLSEYNFADYYAEEGVNYYRLFQTDVDGQSRELKTISVYNNCLTGSGIEVSASFNSMDNSITVGYNFDRDQMVHAALYNSLGQMVQTTDLFLDASERKAQIDLNETLSFGIYFLKLSNDEFMVSEKILISK